MYEQQILQAICDIRNILAENTIRDEKILSICIPEFPTISSPVREFAVGITRIDFLQGMLTNPNGTTEQFISSSNKLAGHNPPVLRSISIENDQDIILTVNGFDGTWSRRIKANANSGNFTGTFLEYTSINIICITIANITIFSCTNPQAVLNLFSVQAVATTTTQDAITGDNVESQTYGATTTLLENLNRIRNILDLIIGETNWNDTPNTTLALADTHIAASTAIHGLGASSAVCGLTDGQTLTNKTLTTPTISSFANANHTHVAAGATGGVVSHTNLTDGAITGTTNSHAQIDTAIGTTLPGLVTTHAALTATHGASGNILGKTTADGLYAPISTAGFTTQTVVTGSRVLGTVYMNTTGKTMFVTVTTSDTNASTSATAYTDSNATPTTIVGKCYDESTSNDHDACISFMVLNNNYYKVIGSLGNDLSYWVEWTG